MTWQFFAVTYLVLVNLWAFVQMGIDKRRARRAQWRISERRLFIPVILGGGLGGILGIRFFRHKTKHWYFRYGFPLIAVLEIAIAVYVFGKL